MSLISTCSLSLPHWLVTSSSLNSSGSGDASGIVSCRLNFAPKPGETAALGGLGGNSRLVSEAQGSRCVPGSLNAEFELDLDSVFAATPGDVIGHALPLTLLSLDRGRDPARLCKLFSRDRDRGLSVTFPQALSEPEVQLESSSPPQGEVNSNPGKLSVVVDVRNARGGGSGPRSLSGAGVVHGEAPQGSSIASA